MAEESQLMESGKALKKRKVGRKQGGKKSSKKPKMMPVLQGQKKVKIDKRMKKLFQKRAREYNSDDESAAPATIGSGSLPSISNKNYNEEDIEGDESSGEEGGRDEVWNENADDFQNRFSDDEGEEGGIQPGITKFTEGCRAFRMAFRSIIKKNVSDDSLGPVLSGHKKLVIDKLAEEEAECKVKREAKKEKIMLAEKGHVKPASYLDSHEKFLISVATKGAVKLFNAVNKAQTARRDWIPQGIKMQKTRKRTKEAFFSELGRPSLAANDTAAKARESTGKVGAEQPAWAPLRDNYMLTSSRLKDWDKMPDKNVSDDFRKMSEDSSSDDD